MRIIHPHGTSLADNSSRKLLLRGSNDSIDIDAIHNDDLGKLPPKLLMAQYISIIDKIFAKPKDNKPITQAGFDCRKRLGKLIWDHHLGGRKVCTSDNLKIWQFKLHPYKKDNNKDNIIQGGWYQAFLGNIDPKDIDYTQLAQDIHDHLFTRARVKHQQGKQHPKGLATARATSIAVNTPEKNASHKFYKHWDEYYSPNSDLAIEIYNNIKMLALSNNKYPKDKSVKTHEAWISAIKTLHTHFGKLFKEQTLSQVKDTDLFAQHCLVKLFYRRILKESKADNVGNSLPQNRNQLVGALLHMQKNRIMAENIRMGRAEHFEGNIDTSTSLGLTQIKRNEALMRSFNELVGQAGLTMRGLYPNCPKDIFGGKVGKEHAENTAPEPNKWKVMFPDLNEVNSEGADSKAIGYALVCAWQDIRHKLTHFSTPAELQAAFESGVINNDPNDIQAHFKTMYDAAQCHVQTRLVDALEAIEAGNFTTQEQLNTIGQELQKTPSQPLPKFNRLLQRNQNTHKLDLPQPAKQALMEDNDAFRFRYTVLKMLYQSGFQSWLSDKPLQGWIK